MSRSEVRTFIRFVVLCAGLAIGAYALVIAANLIAADRTMPYLYHLTRLQRSFLNGSHSDLKRTKLILTGDSTASRDLMPAEILPFDSWSLAINGGSAVEVFYTLKRAYDNGARPSCVVVMTSYGAYELHQQERFWQQSIPIRILEANEVEHFYSTTRSIGREPGKSTLPGWGYLRAAATQILFYANWSKLSEAIFMPYVSHLHPRRAYRSFRYSRGAAPSSAASLWTPEPFVGTTQGYLKEEFRTNVTVDLYLRKIFELTAANKSRVLLLMPPFAISLRTSEAEKWTQDYTKHMETIGSEFSNVRNRMRAEWLPRSEFLDSSHLDEVGAARFSARMKETISSCGEKPLPASESR